MPSLAGGEAPGAGLGLARRNRGDAVPEFIQGGLWPIERPLLDGRPAVAAQGSLRQPCEFLGELKGGIGHTELDLTGELGTSSPDVRISVGVGEIKLSIPRDADVTIEAEGSFLSNISAPSFEKDGRTYTHRGEGARIHINVKSGVGSVEVELI